MEWIALLGAGIFFGGLAIVARDAIIHANLSSRRHHSKTLPPEPVESK